MEIKNVLGTERIGKLLLKFAAPAVIGNLINAAYNIADQIFVGQKIGILGNAATNVSFPLVTLCAAIGLLLGVGSASNFNLQLGMGNKDKAVNIAGNGLLLAAVCGAAVTAAVLIFLNRLIVFFGATPDVLPHALTYTEITAFGIPLTICSMAGSNLIRADGSPAYSMISISSGAILNIILDPIFIFAFNMDMAGAAIATVIGQALSFVLVAAYFFKFKPRRFTFSDFKLNGEYIKRILSLGVAASLNQIAMMIVQITLNNTLASYGAASRFGSDIPLACIGVLAKLNMIYMSVAIGIAQGAQPINGFNYGAKNYARVKRSFFTSAVAAAVISTFMFLMFQIFPRQIVSVFGGGSEIYFEFSERYLRIYMFCTFLNGFQPVTSNFFTAIGKAAKGLVLSLTRQILFLMPLIIIFPIFLGIDGVMYAGPIADFAAAVLAFRLIFSEMKRMGINKI